MHSCLLAWGLIGVRRCFTESAPPIQLCCNRFELALNAFDGVDTERKSYRGLCSAGNLKDRSRSLIRVSRLFSTQLPVALHCGLYSVHIVINVGPCRETNTRRIKKISTEQAGFNDSGRYSDL